MTAADAGVEVHYLPAYLHPSCRRALGLWRGNFANAEFVGERIISLPLTGGLDDGGVEDVIAAFRRILTYRRR
jgi:dTDP-4-amino-4,6-dideoxygalactose transaminase